MSKILLLIIVMGAVVGCGDKSSIPLIEKQDTVVLSREIILKHDTLVIMVTRDSVRYPVFDDSNFIFLSGGYETRWINLFENGKTIDTIFRHEIIYY